MKIFWKKKRLAPKYQELSMSIKFLGPTKRKLAGSDFGETCANSSAEAS